MNSLEKARIEINDIDRQMAELFQRRMQCCAIIGEYKKNNGIPIRDEVREREIIERNCTYISEDALKEYYTEFLKNNIRLSCRYQEELPESAIV